MHRSPVTASEVRRSLFAVAKTLRSISAHVEHETLSDLNKRGPQLQTRIQTFFNLRFASNTDAAIYDLVMQHALASEKLGPGGFDACIMSVVEGLERLQQGNHQPTCRVTLDAVLGDGATVAKSTDVAWVIRSYAASMTAATTRLLEHALDLAGFAGRIVVEKSRSDVASVELVKGYTFETSPAWPLVARLERPRVACVDGYIESVSEVHHLLEASGEAKEPMLLFVRGLHPDVLNTLRVNFDRGSLVVVPVLVPLDLEGMNTLKDVAIASGGDLVSNLKGQLISSIDYPTLACIDSASVYRNKVVLTNKGSRRAVAAHVKDLRTRRDDPTIVDDVGKLLDCRIRALSPNHVIVRIPDDKDFVVKSQSMDYALRSLRSLIDYGTVIIDGKRELTATAVASRVHAQRCLDELAALGCIVAVIP